MLEKLKERVQDGTDALRDYTDRNPDFVRKVGPIATCLLLFIGTMMLFRAFREVPPQPEASRGHPLAALQEYDTTPSIPPPERAHPLSASVSESVSEPEPPVAQVVRDVAPPDYERASATPEPARPTLDSESEAKATVSRFFRSLNEKSYGDAYRSLSEGWKHDVPFQTFASGYRTTDAVACVVEHVREYEDGRMRVAATLDVIEGGFQARYVASYVLVREDGQWRFDRGYQLKI